MKPEILIEKATKLGFELVMSHNDSFALLRNKIGISHFDNQYSPIGYFICKHWSDEILLDRLRTKLLIDGTPEMAYDYLELMSDLKGVEDEFDTD